MVLQKSGNNGAELADCRLGPTGLGSGKFHPVHERPGFQPFRGPKVVFHSLRHSSTTYKLKLNNGDLKATQGDTGHAQIDMITNVYAHILDEDRKIGAQKFESAFYARPEERNYAKPDLRTVHPPQEEKAPASDLDALLDQLRKSPELASTLASLLGAVTAGKQV